MKPLIPRDTDDSLIFAPFYFVLFKLVVSLWLLHAFFNPSLDTYALSFMGIPLIYFLFGHEFFKDIMVVYFLKSPEYFENPDSYKERLKTLFTSYQNSFYHELNSVAYSLLFVTLFINEYIITSLFVATYFFYQHLSFYPEIKKLIHSEI